MTCVLDGGAYHCSFKFASAIVVRKNLSNIMILKGIHHCPGCNLICVCGSEFVRVK